MTKRMTAEKAAEKIAQDFIFEPERKKAVKAIVKVLTQAQL